MRDIERALPQVMSRVLAAPEPSSVGAPSGGDSVPSEAFVEFRGVTMHRLGALEEQMAGVRERVAATGTLRELSSAVDEAVSARVRAAEGAIREDVVELVERVARTVAREQVLSSNVQTARSAVGDVAAAVSGGGSAVGSAVVGTAPLASARPGTPAPELRALIEDLLKREGQNVTQRQLGEWLLYVERGFQQTFIDRTQHEMVMRTELELRCKVRAQRVRVRVRAWACVVVSVSVMGVSVGA